MTNREAEIRAKIKRLSHRLGRMTTKHPEYAGLHDEISAAVDELLGLPRSCG